MLAPWKESYDKPGQHIKEQRHHFAGRGSYSESFSFSRSHVWMLKSGPWRRLSTKESMFTNYSAREDSWESLGLQGDQTDSKGNSKGNEPWIFTGRTDAETEALIFWPRNVKSQLIRKDPDAGKDWGQEEKGVTAWDGWMVSLIHRIWIWANSGR